MTYNDDTYSPPAMRSKLFVPATRPELFPKAAASAADAICIDLEDAVSMSEKARARELAAQMISQQGQACRGKTLLVRINGLGTGLTEADLQAIVLPGVDIINLPKVEAPADLALLAELLAHLEQARGITRPIRLLANIESPAGLAAVNAIACAHPRLIGLQLGFGDLFEPLGISQADTLAVASVQVAVRMAAGLSGIDAYDAAYTNIRDADGYRERAQSAKLRGYVGKTCIHPSQIGIANEVFSPCAQDLDFARKVCDAWQEAQGRGVGAITIDGRMIDLPFALRAKTLLLRYGQLA